jgi:CHASE3 domain sensor protein
VTIAQKLALGFSLPLVILAGVAGVAYRSTSHLVETGRWVAHTHEVLAEIAAHLALLKEAESAQRGYLLTDDRSFLGPYEAGRLGWEKSFAKLKGLTQDNDQQQRRLEELSSSAWRSCGRW